MQCKYCRTSKYVRISGSRDRWYYRMFMAQVLRCRNCGHSFLATIWNGIPRSSGSVKKRPGGRGGGLEPLTRHGLNQIRADARKRSVVAPKRCAQDGKKFCRKTLMREARNPIRADARKRSVVAPQRCAQNGKKSCRKTLTQPAYARRSTEIGPSLTLRVTMGEKVAMSDC